MYFYLESSVLLQLALPIIFSIQFQEELGMCKLKGEEKAFSAFLVMKNSCILSVYFDLVELIFRQLLNTIRSYVFFDQFVFLYSMLVILQKLLITVL